MPTHALSETLARLYRLHASGIKFGLETVRALLEELNHPERAPVFIHVAGTNGKGSVCAMVEAVLRAAGFRTGLYTSPHLVRFNERIRIDGVCIADQELAPLIELVNSCAQKVAHRQNGRMATFFEVATALAFEFFRRRQVEVVVLETGMGGRLDATNVVDPAVAVITSIGLEHQEYLGDNLAAIAREKGGIIKNGRPVVLGAMPDEAQQVLVALAREHQAPLRLAGEYVSVQRKRHGLDGQCVELESVNLSYGALRLPLIGRHQLENLAVSVTALETFAEFAGRSIEIDHFRQGLAQAHWPGRCQLLSVKPVILLDGAHNPSGACVLSRVLREECKGMPVGLVLGMCRDKDLRGFLRPFAGLARRCWAVPLHNERGRAPQEIAECAGTDLGPVAIAELPDALREASDWAQSCGGMICIAGSLFLAGETLDLLDKQKKF